MFLLTFAIGFLVAFIIKISVRGVELSQIVRDEKYHNELKRLRSIKRIRNSKRLTKMAEDNKVVNYYYGKNNQKTEDSTNDTNELMSHYYGKN
jgi:hypothetical protein